jgi:hypothetical protein
MNKIKLLFLTILSLTAFTFAQKPDESSPAGAREAMLKFVALNNKQLLQTAEARSLFTGEASEWSNARFGQISSQPDKIVRVEKNYAVARVQTIGKDSRVVDLYFYLKFDDGGWKIRSMRAMAQIGFLESINAALKSKAVLTAAEKDTLANTELVLASDKTLSEWFYKNRLALDKLTAFATLETKKKPVKVRAAPRRKITVGTVGRNVATANTAEEGEENEPRTIENITANTQKFPKSAAALKNLHLSALETKSNGNVEITIGGITDNSVGFIYSPSGTPPQIDGWRCIWVEKLAAGWYLFRTT